MGLEAAMNPDAGTSGGTSNDNGGSVASGGGLIFGCRSTVGLEGGFGEIRLGRDYVPTFGNLSGMHPFGTNVRASNSVGYFLPNLPGLFPLAWFFLGA
jgi:predicted porin